jgi:hypothetical protein
MRAQEFAAVRRLPIAVPVATPAGVALRAAALGATRYACRGRRQHERLFQDPAELDG